MSATVTLDRQAAIDLLTETYAVCDVLEDWAGSCPTMLTKELRRRLDIVAFAALGEPAFGPTGEMVGPVVDLWDGKALQPVP
jgi:hypothetical protein